MAEATTLSEKKRRALAIELLDLRHKYREPFDRIEEIKSALKDGVAENCKEVVDGKGEVGITAPKPKRFKARIQQLVAETFLGLTEAKQKKLRDDGIVVDVDEYVAESYGQVRVKLF